MEKEKLTSLVKKAKAGNTDAMEALLRHAYTPVSYQCRRMLKNAQDAEDVTQEILLKAYTKLDDLQNPAAFTGWLNRITATRCINALTRTHVELQFAEDEEGGSVLDSLETTDDRQVPDKAIDNAETARMIDEIVSDLPEAQRMSTLLYYFDEMSVKEIAQIMSVSENTVKGRLSLSRKAIKERVLDYEKQGVKLYSLSVLPFLRYFLQSAAYGQADSAAAAACAASVLAAGGGASSAVGTAAASHTVKFLSGKGIAAIAAGVAAAAGIAIGAILLINQFGDPVPAFICQHEWSAASCTAPQTCTKCGSTQGTALGHEWTDADCVTPRTCSVCGAAEGEPLGHIWLDADCTTPKTCQRCAATQGAALGHSWLAANYQAPQTCSVCGAVSGEALTADFVKYGLQTVTPEMGVEYPYVTGCNDDFTKKTVGKLILSDYREFESGDGFEGKEGYMWHAVTVRIRFDDDNAWDYGAYVQVCRENYYDITGWDDSDVKLSDSLVGYTVNNNGVDQTGCRVVVLPCSFTPWENRTAWYSCDFYWRVPTGYDGFVLGFYDSSITWEDGQHIFDIADENTLLFRF